MFLLLNEESLNYTDDEMEQMIIDVADGKISQEALTKWIIEHT